MAERCAATSLDAAASSDTASEATEAAKGGIRRRVDATETREGSEAASKPFFSFFAVGKLWGADELGEPAAHRGPGL